MAKKILRIGGTLAGLAVGGFPGSLVGGLAGYGASKLLKKKKEPTGIGEPLKIGQINPDGSPIPVDKKRRRLPTSNTLLTSPPSGSTLGG